MRGLKYISPSDQDRNYGWSHPVRGAWIEIPKTDLFCVWIESHPVRGAWIEILWPGVLTLPKRRTP